MQDGECKRHQIESFLCIYIARAFTGLAYFLPDVLFQAGGKSFVLKKLLPVGLFLLICYYCYYCYYATAFLRCVTLANYIWLKSVFVIRSVENT